MSSLTASPDSTPTRIQLRLVVLRQWVRAGLDLARGGGAGRGLVGRAVALWRVWQAVRLALQLIQRLSELQGALSRAASDTASGDRPVPAPISPVEDEPRAAWLRHALIEIGATIRDALGRTPNSRARPDAGRAAPMTAALMAAAPEAPNAPAWRRPPRPRPPDRPPKPQRRRTPRPRPGAAHLDTSLTPFALSANGRRRLAAA